MGGALTVRDTTLGDAAAIAAIYAPYVRDTAITFELDPPDADEMRRRIGETIERFPWLVAEIDGAVVGYAYATTFRARAAYRWIVETTVYVAREMQGRGIGRALYAPLLDRLCAQGFCGAIGAIALPNAGSVAIHETMGFVASGVYRKVGHKLGEWHDVGLWQIDFGERPEEPVEPLLPRPH